MSLCQSPFWLVHQYGVWHILLKLQKKLATMTKIWPAVQISLELLYHHVKLLSQFSGKFGQTIFGNHILHLNSSGTDVLVEGPLFIQSKAILKYT